jgi:putative spermidine/putrescine transport system substrate-binding protein
MDGGIVLQAAEAGVLEQVSKDKVKGLADVPEDTIKAGGKGGIPYRGSSVLLAYNAKTVATPPATFDELMTWIKANPGKFTYNSPKSGGSGGAFVTTVLDKYLPADTAKTLRTTYDKNLLTQWKPGWDALRALNPYVYQKGVYPTGNKGSIELLAGGQIAMTPVWSDMFISGQKSGTIPKDMKATQIANPSFTGGASYLGVPAHAKNKDNAIKLVDYLLSPEAQNMIAKDIAGYPVIPLDKLPADTQATFKDAHPDQLRAGYFDKVNEDRDLAWDQEVPGK